MSKQNWSNSWLQNTIQKMMFKQYPPKKNGKNPLKPAIPRCRHGRVAAAVVLGSTLPGVSMATKPGFPITPNCGAQGQELWQAWKFKQHFNIVKYWVVCK